MAMMVMGPYRMMAAAGYSRETSDGYEKATTFGGYPAVEKWNADRKRGEFTVIVSDRFVVSIEGHEHQRHQDAPRLRRRKSISEKSRR